MSDATFIEGERITLRPIEEDDLEFLHRWENSRYIREAMRGRGPRSRDDVEADRSGRAFEFLVFNDDEPVGYVSLHSLNTYDGHGSISYWMAREHQGRGFATEAVDLVVEYAFEELRLHKVRADVRDFNKSSQEVLERVGFLQEGRLRESRFVGGEHCDRYRYGVLRDEWE